MRDIREKPYTPDEARVATFFCERGVGGGDDPIGSILAGYAFLVEQRNQLQVELDFFRRQVPGLRGEIARLKGDKEALATGWETDLAAL